MTDEMKTFVETLIEKNRRDTEDKVKKIFEEFEQKQKDEATKKDLPKDKL